jgi:hypothetical protein
MERFLLNYKSKKRPCDTDSEVEPVEVQEVEPLPGTSSASASTSCTTQSTDTSDTVVKKKKKKSEASNRKLAASWVQTFPWLVVDANNSRMQCSYCLLFPSLAGNKSSFGHPQGGCTNFHIRVSTNLEL